VPRKPSQSWTRLKVLGEIFLAEGEIWAQFGIDRSAGLNEIRACSILLHE
jgi:hypothetical protein